LSEVIEQIQLFLKQQLAPNPDLRYRLLHHIPRAPCCLNICILKFLLGNSETPVSLKTTAPGTHLLTLLHVTHSSQAEFLGHRTNLNLEHLNERSKGLMLSAYVDIKTESSPPLIKYEIPPVRQKLKGTEILTSK
jgi:hypothetical protein